MTTIRPCDLRGRVVHFFVIAKPHETTEIIALTAAATYNRNSAARETPNGRAVFSHRYASVNGCRLSMHNADANLTQLLRATANGDRSHLDALMAAIYQDLHRLARKHMKAERDDHTLQPTALVHEAYMRLINQHSTDWKDRIHFFAVASRIIRRILVDHAREHRAAKRGGDMQQIPIEEVNAVIGPPGIDLLTLDEALNELAEIDSQQAKIVELRYFSGLTVEEVAELLSIGKRSVDREWQCAKAWLFCRLSDSAAREPGDKLGRG
jgi:RNA polymerase sigma-70 factor, ECF subfamily